MSKNHLEVTSKNSIAWTEVSTCLTQWKELSTNQTVPEVRLRVQELVHKLAKIAHVKRVRAIAPRFPNLHCIDFELELQLETELSHEGWNNAQDLVIDCEWKLRDDTGEKWYFHPEIVYMFYPLESTSKVIADSYNGESVDTSIIIWSSPPLKFVVY